MWTNYSSPGVRDGPRQSEAGDLALARTNLAHGLANVLVLGLDKRRKMKYLLLNTCIPSVLARHVSEV